MRRNNDNSEVEATALDVEHELPPAKESSGAASVPENAAESELQKLRRERDDLVDRVARLQAEFENARKRVAREQQEFRDFAMSDALRSLLPVLDSFDRALQLNATTEGTELRSGVELIHKQLQDALSKLGLSAIPAQGALFDPHLHQAIEMVDTNEVEDQHVLEELQRGYKLKDRLLRPAMVRVARNSQ